MSRVDINEVVAASKAATAAGDNELALELLENAQREILGDVWLSVSLCESKPFHEHDPGDQELILREIGRVIRGEASPSPANTLVRAAIAASKIRALGSIVDRIALDKLEGWCSTPQYHRPFHPTRFCAYDSIHADDGNAPFTCSPTGSLRMFSNANIGFQQRTNIRVPGQLMYTNDPYFITSLRVSKPWDAEIEFRVMDRLIQALRIDDLAAHPYETCVGVHPGSRVDLVIHFHEPVPAPFYVYIEGWGLHT